MDSAAEAWARHQEALRQQAGAWRELRAAGRRVDEAARIVEVTREEAEAAQDSWGQTG